MYYNQCRGVEQSMDYWIDKHVYDDHTHIPFIFFLHILALRDVYA